VEELQLRGSGIKFGYDRAGATTAAKEDDQLWEEYHRLREAGKIDQAKAKVKQTKWFWGYQSSAKALIKLEMQNFDGVLVVLCLEGGLITQVEAEEMQRIVNDAKKDAAQSHIKVHIELRSMTYFKFLQKYDRPVAEPEPEPEPEVIAASSTGTMDSFRRGMQRIASCRSVLKMDVHAIPEGSAEREEFTKGFAKEMAKALSHLVVQKLDAQGVKGLKEVAAKAEAVA
jgi:hypothetical protein